MQSVILLAICHEHENNLEGAHQTKSFCPQDPWYKWHWSEAPLSILLRGHWELIGTSPCPRSLHDSWARLPGLSKYFTCTNCLTAPLGWMFSILAIQNFQKQIKRCQGTQWDSVPATLHFLLPQAPYLLDKAQMIFLTEHLRSGFLCVLKSFMSIILLLKHATI